MKVTKDKVESSQAFLTIEIEPAEIEKSLEEAYHRVVRKANIPGFRKGKAPRAIVERYLGKGNLLEEALDHLIPESYEKALEEQGIEAIAQPQIEVTGTEPVVFKAVVPITPTVDLGDYKQIQVKSEPAVVKDDELTTVLEGLRHQHATWEAVDRPVEFNDLVSMDVESIVEDKPFLNQSGAQFQVLKDLASPVPGFAEQLPGMKKDETKEFKLKFPEDYPREGFAGKEAAFKVKLVEIKQEKLPELNDELAKLVNADFQTLDALRERVSSNLKLRAEDKVKVEFEEHVVDAAVKAAHIEYPPVLVEMEIDRLITDQARRLQLDSRGLEEYLKGIKKTAEQLREELRPLAVERVTRSLVLDKVAEVEKVEATEADIATEIEHIIAGSKETDRDELRKALDAPRSRETIKELLIRRKTIERLAEIGKSAEPPAQTAEKEETK